MRHWHESEDEFVYVLDGELTLVEDGGDTALRAGEAAAWPAGPPTAHRLENRGAADATYLVVGTRAPRDRVHYRDHDLILSFDGPRAAPGPAPTAPSSRRADMPIFHYDLDADGVATIAWDLPGKSMNVLTEEGIAELDAAVDRALADPAVKGIVITSAKPDFAGGMDLNVLARMRERAGDDPARGLFDGIMAMHRLLRKIERAGMDPKTLKGGKPVAWACPGLSAGIGTEIGLACHRRFMADNPKARVGLPEILIGIFPGAGGTTRLVRMLGLMGAAPHAARGQDAGAEGREGRGADRRGGARPTS